MDLGDRMKSNYEKRDQTFLQRRTPVIMRLDGKSFHSITKQCVRPFDSDLIWVMQETALELCRQIQGAKCAYVQSDEISILITDFDNLDTQAWFNNNVQKMTSVSAAIAAVTFNRLTVEHEYPNIKLPAYFDSRVFNIPKEEVNNYFIWRQKDWERNSVFMYANSFYSHRELHQKSNADKHEMLHQKGVNWADLDNVLKNGTFIEHIEDIDAGHETWQRYVSCPTFTEYPYFVNDLVNIRND